MWRLPSTSNIRANINAVLHTEYMVWMQRMYQNVVSQKYSVLVYKSRFNNRSNRLTVRASPAERRTPGPACPPVPSPGAAAPRSESPASSLSSSSWCSSCLCPHRALPNPWRRLVHPPFLPRLPSSLAQRLFAFPVSTDKLAHRDPMVDVITLLLFLLLSVLVVVRLAAGRSLGKRRSCGCCA